MIDIVSPFEEYVRSLLDWSHINNAGGSKLPVGDFCIEFKITSFPSINSSTMFNVLRTIRIPTPTLMHSTRRKSPFEEISFVDLDISCIIYIETISQSFWLDKHCFIDDICETMNYHLNWKEEIFVFIYSLIKIKEKYELDPIGNIE